MPIAGEWRTGVVFSINFDVDFMGIAGGYLANWSNDLVRNRQVAVITGIIGVDYPDQQ
jgi:hypothetical protein